MRYEVEAIIQVEAESEAEAARKLEHLELNPPLAMSIHSDELVKPCPAQAEAGAQSQ